MVEFKGKQSPILMKFPSGYFPMETDRNFDAYNICNVLCFIFSNISQFQSFSVDLPVASLLNSPQFWENIQESLYKSFLLETAFHMCMLKSLNTISRIIREAYE